MINKYIFINRHFWLDFFDESIKRQDGVFPIEPGSQSSGMEEGQKEGGKWLSISRKRNRKNSDISSLHVDGNHM